MYGDKLNASQPEIHNVITDNTPNSCTYQRYEDPLGVNQGTMVFFRVHATETGVNPRIDWDPKIEYVSVPNQLDQNGQSPYIYQYSQDFLMSQKSMPSVFPGSGTASITWDNITVNKPSDNVTFEIVKSIITTPANQDVENSSSNDIVIYKRFCQAGANTIVGPAYNDISGIINNISVTSNDTPGSANTTTAFYFRIKADSNVNWKQIEWKPEINCVTQETVIGADNTAEGTVTTNQALYPIPEVSIYKVYNAESPGGIPPSYYPENNSSSFPINSNGLPLFVLPYLNGIFSSGDHGNLRFVVKRDGLIVDKREITINGSTITFNNPSPINLGLVNNDKIEFGFYANDSDLQDNAQPLLKKLAKQAFTSPINVLRIAAGNWSTGPAAFLTNDQAMLYQMPSQKFGPMYRQWGQFAYNPKLVSYATSSPYGDLINRNVLTITTDPSAVQQAVNGLESLGENITVNDLDNFEAQYGNFYNFPFFMMQPKREMVNNVLSEKWFGTCPQNYASALSYRAAGMDEVRDEYMDPDDYSVQDVLDTGAYGINKYSKGKSKNISAGASLGNSTVSPTISVGASVSKSLDAYSNNLTDYVDLNGDRYPDIVSSNAIQYTLRTGGLRTSVPNTTSVTNTGTQTGKGTNSTLGFSASGSFSMGGKQETSTSGQKIDSFRFIGFRGNSGAGISGNFSRGESQTSRMFADVNGDGLADILEKNGTGNITVLLNCGNNSFLPEQFNASSWALTEMFNSTSNNYGGGLGINKWNGSVELGFSLSSGRNNVENTLNDINGDGIADVIHSDDNGILVRVNNGSGFAPVVRWSDFRMNHETETATTSKNAGLTGAIVFPIPFIGTCLKIALNLNGTDFTSTNRTKKSISDFDGDGFPDLIREIDNHTLGVQYSNIKRTNMLKAVHNPIGSTFTVDYDVITPTYNNPNAKWVMKSVVVNDGYNLVNDGEDTYKKNFEYENGVYDRREREFYGFEKVKTIDNILDAQGHVTGVYRTSISVFHNNSYFLNGLSKWSYVIKGNDETQVYSRSINNYKIKKLTNAGLIDLTASAVPLTFDVGGSEGRRAAAVVLESTESYIYELGTTPLISKVFFTYDDRARVLTYQYKGNVAVAEDDYSAKITYYSDPVLASKNIYNVPGTIIVKDYNNVELRNRVVTSINTNTGDILIISAKTDASTWAETKMEYNPYGNLIKIILPANENGEQATYSYTYDADNQKLPVSVEDHFGYISYTEYDYRFDKPVQSKDISGNMVNYTYDSFSRLLTVQSPREIANSVPYTISFGYYPNYQALHNAYGCAEADNFMPVAVTSHYDEHNLGNDIQTYTFIDGLARPVQVKKDIELNYGDNSSPELREAVSISGKVYYDQYGRAVKQYHPYFEGKDCSPNLIINEYDSPYFATTEYDELDRPVRSVDPEGNESTVAYSLDNDATGHPAMKTASRVDQNGAQSIVTESYKDVNGRVTSTKNILTGNNAADIWTQFNYNAIGELKSYTDAEHITTTYAYDMAGRKTEIVHPDNGKTNYFYDTSGNMTKLQTANLANDQSLPPNDRFIKYLYEYNRLIRVIYPVTPNSSANISDVKYAYGSSGNETGRVVTQSDATGMQTFNYGPMGEVIANTRTVVSPNIPTRTFTTEFSYDSWNRINSITYPDGEVVTHDYNLGGNLVKISGTVSGSPYDYVRRIDYDYYEQRTYMLYGNGTDMAYQYTPALRRLDTLVARTSSQENFLDNRYAYDKVGNVTGLANFANPNSNNLMGGNFSHSYTYDNLNRLINAHGDFSGNGSQLDNNNDAGSDYQLDMGYNLTHGIVYKKQQHNKNNQQVDQNTYENGYKYIGNNHKLKYIQDAYTGTTDAYVYDGNGNTTLIDNNNTGVSKKMYWDESNRLRVVDNGNDVLQHYIYDAQGERVLKGSAQPEQLYNNGQVADGDLSFDAYTTYPSAYIVVNPDGRFSKHYYAGSQRVVSRVADDDAGIFEGNSPRAAAASGSDENTFSEDDLQKAQVSDLNRILEKANKGVAKFKDYQPDTEEITDDDDTETKSAQRRPEGTLYFYHPDHLGTSTFLTDMNGDLYQFFLNLPFGETMAEQHSLTADYETPYKFNGKELDTETGLYYYGARYYDPRTSIWLSTDPLMEKYPNVNPYVYCVQNPVNYIDPTGMSVDPPDTYIDSYTGAILGKDGATTNDVRIIHGSDWSETTALYKGSTSQQATEQLQSQSSVITVNESQIGLDIKAINSQTISDQTKERQVFIGLSVDDSSDYPCAVVTSCQGPVGKYGETEYYFSESGRVNEDGSRTLSSKYFRGTSLIPIAQAHTHHIEIRPGMANVASTSVGPDKDSGNAMTHGISIYAIDSWTKVTKGGNDIHCVTSKGTPFNKVGTTEHGNIGQHALSKYVNP